MITILIATYNGEKTLSTVLNAYRKLVPPNDEWKLVIMDNGSNDNTKEIIKDFLSLLPITYAFEPRRGKNAALNTGLSQIEDGLIVFSDDDVLPYSNWLKQLSLTADSQPSFSIFGGPILPRWESPPEEWILSWVPLKPTFAILDDQEEGIIENYLVFGPNMAVRSKIFNLGYKFDETIGPKGSMYAQGSETELLLRLHQAGFNAWHCKKAIVEHMIRSSQMNKKWVLSRAIRFGRGQYRLGSEYTKVKPCFWGIPRGLILQILSGIYHLGKLKLFGDAEGIFRGRWYLNYLFGKALEARLICKERNKAIFRRLS